jgi:hypothetical protein
VSSAAREHQGQVAASVGGRHSQAFLVAPTVGESRERAPGEWGHGEPARWRPRRWHRWLGVGVNTVVDRHLWRCHFRRLAGAVGWRLAPPEMSLPEVSRGYGLEGKQAKSVKLWHLRRWEAPPEMAGLGERVTSSRLLWNAVRPSKCARGFERGTSGDGAASVGALGMQGLRLR